jgi:Na+-transporting methylmalonyl-CoA/oxaloacetate decarboxylase gamma subunit
MGVVFVVLALLALSIKGLSLLDREPSPVPQATIAAATPGAGATIADSAPSPTGEITGQQVAAIAVALALSEQTAASPLTTSSPSATGTTSPGAGSWLQSGRIRNLGSTMPSVPGTKRRSDQ